MTNRITQFLADWPGLPTAPAPVSLDDLAEKVAKLLCPPPGPDYVERRPKTDAELQAEVRDLIEIYNRSINMPWQAPTECGAMTVQVVYAFGMARGLGDDVAHVSLTLERSAGSSTTHLTITNGDALVNSEGGDDDHAVLEIRSPEALRALTAALIKLQQSSDGERMLETVESRPSTPPTPAPGDHCEEEDDDEWKKA